MTMSIHGERTEGLHSGRLPHGCLPGLAGARGWVQAAFSEYLNIHIMHNCGRFTHCNIMEKTFYTESGGGSKAELENKYLAYISNSILQTKPYTSSKKSEKGLREVQCLHLQHWFISEAENRTSRGDLGWRWVGGDCSLAS